MKKALPIILFIICVCVVAVGVIGFARSRSVDDVPEADFPTSLALFSTDGTEFLDVRIRREQNRR